MTGWTPTFKAPTAPRELEPVERTVLPVGRNGIPEPRPYVWRGGGETRQAEVLARVAAAKAEARRRHTYGRGTGDG